MATEMQNSGLSVSDITDLLADDVDKTNDTKEPDDKKEPETKDDKEEKEEEPEPDKEIELEEVDDIEFQDVPNRKEIIKQFPELFKKFPGIEKAIYREREYSEIFPTITEARDAVESVKQYQAFESSLLSGDLTTVLNAVKNADQNAYKKIADNFLGIIGTVDQQAYNGIIGDVISRAIYTMALEGQNRQNENLSTAAQIMQQFIFGNTQITKPVDKVQNQHQPNAYEQSLQQRESQFFLQQVNVATEDVTGKAEGVIKGTIEKNIDPKDSMSPYVKNKAISEALDLVKDAIKSDRRFSIMLDNLWKNAIESGYTADSKKKIKDALYSKARTVLPDIIRSVRADALKGSSSKSRSDDETDKRPIARGKPAAEGSKSKLEIKPGEKTRDFFMRD